MDTQFEHLKGTKWCFKFGYQNYQGLGDKKILRVRRSAGVSQPMKIHDSNIDGSPARAAARAEKFKR